MDMALPAIGRQRGLAGWEVSLARKTRCGKGLKEVQGGAGVTGAVLGAEGTNQGGGGQPGAGPAHSPAGLHWGSLHQGGGGARAPCSGWEGHG